MTQYGIIIPAYNESARLARTLDRVLEYVKSQGWAAEIIVVDDGSKDETAAIAEVYSRSHPGLRLLNNPGNRGKGYSVRNGMLHATADFLLFTDADLSSPIEEAGKLFTALRSGADIAIGSRWLQPELQVQRQSRLRQIYGRIFNLMLKIVLGLNFKDTQCGFKAFTRNAAQTVFPMQKVERWGFDPELLFLARRAGLKVKEVPVAWSHDEGTRIHPLRDGMHMFGEVLAVRADALMGKYPKY
jgi:dolichyl-phosphate beta-glucosyltransferase